MAPSSEYKSLKQRISTLNRTFIPQKIHDIPSLSTKKLDHARAYRLLAHAELEHYFEHRAQSIAKKALELWTTKNKTSHPLQHLTCNIIGEMKGLVANGNVTTASSIIKKAYAQYTHSLKNNHGIKRINILTILLPLGIQEDDIDQGWLSTIDGFGKARGETAHTSGIINTINPYDDHNTLNIIMDGIKSIDSLLNKLIRTIK